MEDKLEVRRKSMLSISLEPSEIKGTVQKPTPLGTLSVSEFINTKTFEMMRSREPVDHKGFLEALDSHAFGELAKKGRKK